MSSGKQFVYADSTISIPRSSFPMNNRWQGDIYHGDLVPIDILEVMPSDSFKVQVDSFIRTATPPIAPIMDQIIACIAAFFVPKRLIFDKTKQFYGENVEGYGVQSAVYEPRGTVLNINTSDVNSFPHCFGKYFATVRQGAVYTSKLNFLPARSYLQVYNDWFRNENFHSPYLWDHSQTGDSSAFQLATLEGVNQNGKSSLPTVCKQLDVFTSALPWAQKLANPVLLPFASASVPVDVDDQTHDVHFQNGLSWTNGSEHGLDNLKLKLGIKNDGADTFVNTGETMTEDGGSTSLVVPNNLVANFTSAIAPSVNELRVAVATQRYFETLARTGSKYREVILGIFGCSIGDSTAQMAEYLGGQEIFINVDQVLQTTGYAAGNTSVLARPGATSVTAASQYLWTKSFQEPGYVVTVMYFKHQRSYSQGVDSIWKKRELFDYYNPKFAHVGEIPLKKSEIYFTGNEDDDDISWGFQEYGNEYHYKKDVLVGMLSPANSSSYNFWNLGEKFSSAPTLNGAFLKEDRYCIARCLQGGENTPDYFVDLNIKRTAVRPMPLHSIPGLMDHF